MPNDPHVPFPREPGRPDQDPIDLLLRRTYLQLRLGIAIIAFSLPWILWLGGLHAGIPLLPSMSAYYHATHDFQSPSDRPCPQCESKSPTCCNQTEITACKTNSALPQGTLEPWFVGFLFAVGALLFVYQGLSRLEYWLLNLAGAFAIGVALFPMPWVEGSRWSIHGTCAVAFFVLLALVCVLCSGQSLTLIKDEDLEKRLRSAYWVLAAAMLLSPLTAAVLNALGRSHTHFIFLAEFCGVYSFGLYWCLKTYEFSLIRKRGRSPAEAVEPSFIRDRR